MQAIFFTFSKRINSTKVPNDASGAVKNVVLKDNTSINQPTLKIENPDLSYNYVKFAGHYYFIQDYVLQNRNIYEVKCTIDVLATYRGDILGYTAYVKRSASSYNVNLNDDYIPSGQNIVQTEATSQVIDSNLNTAPHYALRTISGDGIRTYWLSYIQLKDVLDGMFTEANIVDVITDALKNFFVNPQEYVISLMYFRCTPQSTGTSSVKYGFFDTEVNATYVDLLSPIGNYTNPLSVPSRYYNDYRDFSSQFTTCWIYFAGYGMYQLDAIYLQTSLSYTYTIDYITGGCTIRLRSNGEVIAVLNGTIGANIQIAGSASDLRNAISSGLELAGGIALGQPEIAVKGAMDLSHSIFNPAVSVNGTNTTIAQLVSNPSSIAVIVQRVGSAGIPISEKGRPYCQNALLSSLSGYCECLNASVPTNADEAMKAMINDTLNSGFYIE